jgi:hypothetical protein
LSRRSAGADISRRSAIGWSRRTSSPIRHLESICSYFNIAKAILKLVHIFEIFRAKPEEGISPWGSGPGASWLLAFMQSYSHRYFAFWQKREFVYSLIIIIVVWDIHSSSQQLHRSLSQTQKPFTDVAVKDYSTINRPLFRKINNRSSFYRSYTDSYNAKVFIPLPLSLIMSKRERHTG